jgi:uncharacterized protein YsxB (DUF464 family)
MASNLLEQFGTIETQLESGYLTIHIINSNDQTDKIMRVIELAIKDLVNQYPKHITIHLKEE